MSNSEIQANNYMDIKQMAVLSFLLAVAVVLGYIEVLFPFNFGIPGIKIGLANVVSLFILYQYRYRDALVVGILRILIIGFLFGNLFMIIYSLSGLLLSITLMIFLKKSSIFSIIGVSVAGAISHNIGQLIVAFFVVRTMGILTFYVPVLLVAGVIAGLCTGIITTTLMKIFNKY